jgi:hypothetical protein
MDVRSHSEDPRWLAIGRDARTGMTSGSRARRREPSPEIAAECERVAAFLLQLARRGQVEEALGSILDELDVGMKELDETSRRRAERIYGAVFENHIAAQERRLRREGVDPYFWG